MKKDNNIKNKANYQNLRDKYLNAAKDASASDDIVLVEHNLQHAEHYKRIISEHFTNNEPIESQVLQNKQNVHRVVTEETKEKPIKKFYAKKTKPKTNEIN